MTPTQIRKLDTICGKYMCFFLTGVRRVIDFFSPSDSSKPIPHKVLFIKLIEQGATVLATPAIRRAGEVVGRENVFFIVFEDNREILSILDLLPPENVIIVRQTGFLSFLFDMIRALMKIRRLKIDATIDMEFYARASAIISFLSGASIRVGMHRFNSEAPYRGDLMTHRVQYNPYLHTALFYRMLVEAMGADPQDVPLWKGALSDEGQEIVRFVPRVEEQRRMWERIGGALGDVPPGRMIILNPNASDLLPLRKWPEENFVALGHKLLTQWMDVIIVLTGTSTEARACEDLARRIGSERVICLAGKTTLRELIVLYTLADVLVTNDSGPGHFASLTDIFNIILFGPETPLLFGPVGGRGRVIHAGLACSPCVNVYNHRFSPCRNNACMKAIPVEDVFETIRIVLEEGDPEEYAQ